MAWPIKLLFLPTRITELLHDRGVDVNKEIRRSNRKKKNRWVRILSAPFRFIAAPAYLIRSAFRRRKQKQLLYFIPASLAVILCGFIWYQIVFHSDRVQNRYFRGALKSMSSGNMTLARTYFQRLMDRDQLSAQQTLQWAFALQRTGEMERADAMIRSIAPDDDSGYPSAHAVRAIQIATSLDEQLGAQLSNDQDGLPDSTKAELKLLKFHLSHADNLDPRINLAWATYYRYSDKLESAIDYLTRVAKEGNPSLYLTVARLAKEAGKESTADDAIEKAVIRLSAMVSQSPMDVDSRVFLANAMIKRGQMDGALKVLDKGLELQDHSQLRRAKSDFYIVSMDRLEDESFDTEFDRLVQQFDFLKLAILSDNSYALPYEKLMKWLDRHRDQPELRRVLEAMVTSNRPSPLDQIGIAYGHWVEGDRESARFHLDQAFRMSDRFVEFGHRIAMPYAFRDEPETEWALEVVRRATAGQEVNSDAEYSLGMVLLQAGEPEQAVEALKRSLDAKPDFPIEIQQALVSAYEASGDLSSAEVHQRELDKLKTKTLMTEFDSK